MKTVRYLCIALAFCGLALQSPAATVKDTAADKTGSRLPVIGLGYGALTFIGDIGKSYVNTPFFYRGAFQLEVQLHSQSNLELYFHLASGKLYGEEKTLTRNVNFKSSLFLGGANLRYSFRFRKYPEQVVIPFVAAGIEAVAYNPYTDLEDAAGNPYYYWADGTIRSADEASGDKAQAKIVYRDYNYETNVRESNLDSLGKFRQVALGFPVSVGVKFNVSPRVALHFTETYHFTTTDYIDGITPESKGERAGKKGNDNFLYSAISFHYDLAAPKQQRQPARPGAVMKPVDPAVYNNINYDVIQRDDADGDGVHDFMDEDNNTPAGVKVDAQGRALDSDGDGVPDYRDKEPNSATKTFVDEYGVTITDSTQEAKFIKDSIAIEMSRIAERVRTKNDPQQVSAAGKSQLPDEFKSVDANNDGVISADEIAKAIEAYTAGKSPFNKKQFYRLVDYFFAQ